MNDAFVVIFHAAVTWALCGLIWMVQIVHYPLFAAVGREHFVSYHQSHTRLISWIVMPLMLLEVASAFWLVLGGEWSWVLWVSIASLAVVWISTGFLQVPLHGKLAMGYDPALIKRLVRGNWWRTLAWTVRGVCVAILLSDYTSL